ncbi:MAG: hypothetical protein K5912_01785 [Alphaproteobacteria bacterium]|nr:hypothetical protein [Alphaproteobacteria bacterium]
MNFDSKTREEKIFLRVVVILGLTALVAYICTSCYAAKNDKPYKPKFKIEKAISVAVHKAQELSFACKR